MKTVTFQEILNLAANYAARTTAKLPVAEQTLLQAYLAGEFEPLLRGEAWPFTIPAVFNVTAVDRQFSKNEGSADPLAPEMGDILAVMLRNPQTSRRGDPGHVAFSEGDDVVNVETDATSLWVEYQLPYPGVTFPALAPMTLANFLAATCPREWKQILARRAAAELLNADSDRAGMGVQYGLAEKALVSAINRLPPTPWWRATARLQRPREQRIYGNVY